MSWELMSYGELMSGGTNVLDSLETGVICQEDLANLSMLQKKTQVPDKPDPATTSGKKKLLTLTARLLSHQSLLHIGYREVEDKEKLVTERHR